MGVREKGEVYRCNTCGNEIKITYVGGGTLTCCGRPMEMIKEGVPEEEEEEVREEKEEEKNWGGLSEDDTAQEPKEGEIEEDMNKGFAG
jgi:desulfoferrodoxin-like iron-binding protein